MFSFASVFNVSKWTFLPYTDFNWFTYTHVFFILFGIFLKIYQLIHFEKGYKQNLMKCFTQFSHAFHGLPETLNSLHKTLHGLHKILNGLQNFFRTDDAGLFWMHLYSERFCLFIIESLASVQDNALQKLCCLLNASIAI